MMGKIPVSGIWEVQIGEWEFMLWGVQRGEEPGVFSLQEIHDRVRDISKRSYQGWVIYALYPVDEAGEWLRQSNLDITFPSRRDRLEALKSCAKNR